MRDAKSGKRIAAFPSPTASLLGAAPLDTTKTFIGISGRRATLSPVTQQLPGAMLHAGYLDPEELPGDAIGYDCLDVLVLNAPNLSALSVEQQQAIADWVRAGGSLIVWPSEDPVPVAGPLVDLLPCQIGQSTLIERPAAELARVGLPARFGKLPARGLLPRPGAEPVALLGGDRVTAYRWRAGLGRVLVAPIDLSGLMFNDSMHLWGLWKPVLDGMVRKLPDDASKQPEANRFYGTTEAAVREGAAVREVGDLLGNVPGAGRFGFGYVAGVMIGMMVVVGPVDWFVLKKLGRQPWTWVTTAGWILLVTLSAVYAGHLVKSGELHFRTFQLVDQAHGATVAGTSVVALYSPRTADYAVTTPAQSWWQPVSPGDEYYYNRQTAGSEIGFHQTYLDNRPEPMAVNVWNLRFLRGESRVKGTSLVDAALRVVPGANDSGPRLVGTVTNPGPTALKNLAVRTKDGLCMFAARAPEANQIAPGQTVKVDAVIDPVPRAEDADPNDARLHGYYSGDPSAATSGPGRLWEAGGNLAIRRSDRITQWLSDRDDLACVCAEIDPAEPTVRIAGRAALEQHWKVVRALVPLDR